MKFKIIHDSFKTARKAKNLLDKLKLSLLVPLNGKLERSMYKILGHGQSDFEVSLASKGIRIWHSL